MRYILAIRIFGFKIQRLLEFSRVLVLEFGVASWPKRIWMIGKIVATLAKAARNGGKIYRERMRSCQRCVFYQPDSKQCGSTKEDQPGCGCYMPFKAAIARTPAEGCWLEEMHGIKKWDR